MGASSPATRSCARAWAAGSPGARSSSTTDRHPMTLAIVFPGQGSQSVGMMKGFADRPIVEKTFREASDIAGVEYWTMANEGPAEAQNQSVNTQPLMLIAGVGFWRAWREAGG